MEQLQIFLFSALWLLVFLNIWYFAKYGLVETSLPIKENSKFYQALMVLLLVFAFLLLSEMFLGKVGLLKKPEIILAERIIILAQIIFFFAARFIILKSGTSEYNRARIRLLYVKKEYFAPGQILRKSSELAGSKMSLKALRLFDKAIKKAGEDKLEDGSCDPKTLLNVAIAYSEKGLLLRIMNNFSSAEAAFCSSKFIISNLLAKDSDNRQYRSLESTNCYRQGELKQCQGLIEEAKTFFEASLKIDREHDGDKRDIFYTQCLINKLEKPEEVEA